MKQKWMGENSECSGCISTLKNPEIYGGCSSSQTTMTEALRDDEDNALLYGTVIYHQ